MNILPERLRYLEYQLWKANIEEALPINLEMEQLCESYLTEHPEDNAMLLYFALVVETTPLADTWKAPLILECLLQQNPRCTPALLIIAFIYSYSRYIDPLLIERLKQMVLYTQNLEELALLHYMIAWGYITDDPILHLHHLDISISYCDAFVWPLRDRARSYIEIKNYKGAYKDLHQAIINVQKIYKTDSYYPLLSPQEYIGEHIKGIYLSEPNYEMLLAFPNQIKNIVDP